jgi:hypothetical protein
MRRNVRENVQLPRSALPPRVFSFLRPGVIGSSSIATQLPPRRPAYARAHPDQRRSPGPQQLQRSYDKLLRCLTEIPTGRLAVLSRVLAVLCVVTVPYLAYRALNRYENPVVEAPPDNGDPCIVFDRGEYIMTATSRSAGLDTVFPLWHSRNLTDWRFDAGYRGIPSRELPQGPRNFWSPDLVVGHTSRPEPSTAAQATSPDRYTLYYSAVPQQNSAPRIQVATADHIWGPYRPRLGSLVDSATDPMAFEDNDGRKYLFWVRDEGPGKAPTEIRGGRLTDDGTELVDKQGIRLIPTGNRDVHNPFVIRIADTYNLLYSTGVNDEVTCRYEIVSSQSDHVLSGYDAHTPSAVVGEGGDWACLGMGSVIPAGQEWYLAYHAFRRNGGNVNQRSILLDRLSVEGSRFVVPKGIPSTAAWAPLRRQPQARLKHPAFWITDVGLLAIASLLWFAGPRGIRTAYRKRSERDGDERLRASLKEARRIIVGLLPSEPPLAPGIEVAYCWHEAADINGDFYQYRVLPDGRVAVWLVDVEGHGFAAATYAAMLDTKITDELWKSDAPKDQLEVLDAVISRDSRFADSRTSFCMNLTSVSAMTMRLEHANAGFPPVMLFRNGGIEELKAYGFYVGIHYRQRPHEALARDLQDGDLILLVSDGVTSASGRDEIPFGAAELRRALQSLAGRPVDEIASGVLAAVAKYAGRDHPEDDQTVVVIRVRNPLTLERRGNTFLLLKRPDTLDVADQQLWPAIRDWSNEHGFEEWRINEVWGAVWEGILNAVRYGTPDDSFITIRLGAGKTHIEVGIEQFQAWDFATRAFEEQATRGIGVMRLLADRIVPENDGREIKLEFEPRCRKIKTDPL